MNHLRPGQLMQVKSNRTSIDYDIMYGMLSGELTTEAAVALENFNGPNVDAGDCVLILSNAILDRRPGNAGFSIYWVEVLLSDRRVIISAKGLL